MPSLPTRGPESRSSWWSRLSPYVGHRRRALIVCGLLSVSGQGLMGILPLLQKVVLDDAVLSSKRPLLPWLTVMLGVGAASFVLHYHRRYLAARLSLDLQHELRLAIQRRLHSLDFARHDQLSVGDIMARAAGDVTLVQMFASQIPMLIAHVTLLTVALVVMATLAPLLSLVFAVFVPAFFALSIRFRDRVFPASFCDQRLEGALAGVVEEAVSGVRVVKAFGQEEQEISLFLARARDLFRSRLRTARLTAHYSATLQALPAVAQLLVVALGGYLALHERLSLGVFLAFCSYVVQLVAPVRLLSGFLASSQQARVGAERVLELLELEPVVKEVPGAEPLVDCRGSIDLTEVSFGHQGQAPLLKRLSLQVSPGERLGLVGASGSGKTTLALLLARFYDPSSGSIAIDGRDLRSLTLESLRKNVGVVFEDSFLFSTSVRGNIAFGRPDASDAEIERAARAACAHDFIAALPQGYDTPVGERGVHLSGGQRQRIALARAFLANPPILILDDATSAVDADTEEAIHRSLEEQMRDRTTIVIAHRQSTLRLATRAVVLEHGMIVAQGTPEELLRTSTLYQKLLIGTDVAAETLDASHEPTRPDPRAWPEGTSRAGTEREASVESRVGIVAMKGSGPGGGEHRDFGTGRAAFVSATPELLAQVAKLPAPSGEPEVDLERLLDAPAHPFAFRDVLRPFVPGLLVGLVLVSVDAATTLAAPLVIGRGVDLAVVTKDERALWGAVAALAVVQFLTFLNARLVQFQTTRTAERLLFALRARTFTHLQRLSVDYFDRELGGRIMARMTTDIEAFSQLIQQGLLTAVVSLLTCGGIFVVLLTLDLELSLHTFLVLPLLAAGTVAFQRCSSEAYLRARDRIARLYAQLQESIAGIRVTQAFARADTTTSEFAELSADYRDARLHSMRLVSLYFPFVQFLSVISKAVTLGVGATQIASGRIGAGVLIAFLLYLDQFFAPLQQLWQVFDQWIQARVSFARIRELLAIQSSTPEKAGARDPGALDGAIRFENVRFAYSSDGPEALRGIDLEIEAGQTVGLVGTTGAGKSTFVKLAARFYDPTHGRVAIDGIPLTDMAMGRFREQLGYVPQEPFLFSGTVLSNVRYARPEASDLEIERAARAVGAHDFIAGLPHGYLTPVAAGGRSLSAGQRQLLCLARAELVRPKILILDEATANLDLDTEAEVQRAMRRVARGRTTLLIAHRLQTARAADRIVVIENGTIAESGSHDELVSRGGRYARLWDAFRRNERSAGVAPTGT